METTKTITQDSVQIVGTAGSATFTVVDESDISLKDWVSAATKKKHAYLFLEQAAKEMKDRAAQRDVAPKIGGDPDKPTMQGGERSMASTVKAFNALTGKNLTEAEGWEFMILLKLVRGRQGDFRMDDYTDAAAYSALLGECESINR